MDAAEPFQNAIVQALHADAQPVDPCIDERPQFLCIEGTRIGLHGDLQPVTTLQTCPAVLRKFTANEKRIIHSLQDTLQLLRGQKRRCAAADKDGVDVVAASIRFARCRDILTKPSDIGLDHVSALLRERHEIAVIALAHAERDMQVEPQRL